jgi:ferritin
MAMDSKLIAAWHDHVGMEARNGLVYFLAYSWLRANGWEGFAKHFKKEAADEFGHAQNWIKYLARRNLTVPSLSAGATESADSPAGWFAIAREMEETTEMSMQEIVEMATELGDHQAVEWASTKLEEQERWSKDACDLACRVADVDAGCLVLLDREFEG